MTAEEEKKFVEECLSWVGTKWMHRVALKGVGVDCVMILVSLAKFMCWLDKNYKVRVYPQDWHMHNARSMLMDELEKYCVFVPMQELAIGDILVYRYGRCNSHVGLYIGDRKAVHSHLKRGVEVYGLDKPEMQKRLDCVARWKGSV